MSYNGWRNLETWLVVVWFNPETREDLYLAKEAIDDMYNNIQPGILKDMISLERIDWRELLEHFAEREKEIEEETDGD